MSVLNLFFLGIFFFLMPGVFGADSSGKDSEKNPISLALIRFWQTVISPADGPRSPSFPTGSRYGADAFRRYEFFTALVLTADRLVHEADYPFRGTLRVGKFEKFYDPVIENTYWWDNQYEEENRQKILELQQKIDNYESLYSEVE